MSSSEEENSVDRSEDRLDSEEDRSDSDESESEVHANDNPLDSNAPTRGASKDDPGAQNQVNQNQSDAQNLPSESSPEAESSPELWFWALPSHARKNCLELSGNLAITLNWLAQNDAKQTRKLFSDEEVGLSTDLFPTAVEVKGLLEFCALSTDEENSSVKPFFNLFYKNPEEIANSDSFADAAAGWLGLRFEEVMTATNANNAHDFAAVKSKLEKSFSKFALARLQLLMSIEAVERDGIPQSWGEHELNLLLNLVEEDPSTEQHLDDMMDMLSRRIAKQGGRDVIKERKQQKREEGLAKKRENADAREERAAKRRREMFGEDED